MLGGQIPQIARDWLTVVAAVDICYCWVQCLGLGCTSHQQPRVRIQSQAQSGEVIHLRPDRALHQSEHWKHETDQWETRQPRTWTIMKAANSANNIALHQSMARLNLENIYHYFKWLFIFTMKIEDSLYLTIRFLIHLFALPAFTTELIVLETFKYVYLSTFLHVNIVK